MLQAIREKVVGWVIWVVLVLVGVPFAFWGVDSFFMGGGDPVVAKVGGQKIYQSQFRNAYENRYQQFQQMMGENFRADMFDKARFEKAVLDDLVQEATMRRYTEDAGYRASDAALFEYLSTIPSFQKDGKFDSVTYQETLSRMGRSPQKFEGDLRSAMESDQLRSAVVDTTFVTEHEARAAERLQNQERELSYVSLDPAQYRAQIALTPEQITQKYEAAKASYMAPERVKLAYVELSLEALPKANPPADDVLKVMYEAEKAGRFTTAEQRKARHILINFGADKAAAKTRIEGLAAQLKSGQDFATLATANSDDPGSKPTGGDLGWVKRGQMVGEFEEVLFKLETGKTSEPVETQFGWHLIRLDELKAQQVRAFEEPTVKQELIDLFQSREQQKHYQEKQEKLEQLAFEKSGSLDEVAKELGLSVQVTEWITRAGGSGIAANETVKQAAFSDVLLKDNENSKPLSLGEGRVAVVRKAEYEAPRQRTLDEVKSEIETALLDELARNRAGEEAEQILQAAKAGKPLVDAAKDKNLQAQTPGLVKRDNAGMDRMILDALFKLPRPAEGTVSYGKTTLANGGLAVLALSKVQDSAAADLAPARSQLQGLRAGAEFNAYRKAIEKAVSVKLYEQPQTETAAAETPVEN